MSAESLEMVILHKKVGRNGAIELTVKLGAEVIHADRLEIARAEERERFLDDLCKRRGGINRQEVASKLLEIYATDVLPGATSQAEDADETPITTRSWPAPPSDAVWHGPAGELAKAVEPYTEADPVGVLVQALAAFGNLIGRNCYFEVGATRHYPNLFCCTAGPTGAGRKGTSWDIVRASMARVDPTWVSDHITGGLVSGEGLIWEIRDDAGNEDKRLMAVETEMGGLLKVLNREGNNLSALIRQSWDSGELRSMAKNNQNRATNAHVSIIGHITEHEVERYLSKVDAANGFANRFLWFVVRQSKFLPEGASIPFETLQPIIDRMASASTFAREVRRLERDSEARTLWHEVYPRLCQSRPGLLGSMLGRAVPQAMRMASIYSLLDCSDKIRRVHLEAALALWEYSERSAAFIFGERLGDKDADLLLEALRSNPQGLTRAQIRSDLFQRHKSAEQIRQILGRLLEANLVESEIAPTEGRPATIWRAKAAPKALYAPKPAEHTPGNGANGAYGASPPVKEREVGEL